MNYLSVCSGIEAATVAWQGLKWKPVGYAEIEPFPSAVLAHRHPGVKNYGDLTKYRDWKFQPGAVDLLVGGTPCQSFSVAGLRQGLADPRGNLALVFLGLADRIRPKWLVWENVPGVLSSSGGRDFGAFLGALGQLGYRWAYRVLDAQYFGLAQRRRRVFVVASLGDGRDPAAVLFEPESVRRDPSPSRKAGKVAGTIPSRSSAGGGLGTDFDLDGGCIPVTVGALTDGAHMGGGSTDRMPTPGGYSPPVALCLNAGGMGRRDLETETFVVSGGGFDDQIPTATTVFDTTQVTNPHNRSKPKAGDPCHPLAANAHPPLLVPGLSPTLTAANESSAAVRRLTPTECERLQGFPDGYTAIPWRGKAASECPDGPRYRALGNSMAVPVMRWIGQRIQEVEDHGAN